MKRLILMRHAEAAGSSGDDFDRPLTDLGRAQAVAQGQWLATREVNCDRVLCSPATRAVETAEAAGLRISHPIRAIYGATVGELVRVLESHVDAEAPCLVGHNPGLSGMAGFLTGQRLLLAPAQVIGIHFDPAMDNTPQAGSGRVFLFRPPPPLQAAGATPD